MKKPKNCTEPPLISRLVEVIAVAILRTPEFVLGRFKLACLIKLL